MNLRVVKSLNGGIGVMHGQYSSLYREVGSALWMAGPGVSLLEIAKYLGRLGWAAIDKDGRSFTKRKVKVNVWDSSRPATNGFATDGSNGANIILALSSFATSLPFLAQLTKTCGGTPTIMVAPVSVADVSSTVAGKSWVTSHTQGRCGIVCLRNVEVFYGDVLASEEEIIKNLGDLYGGDGMEIGKASIERGLGGGYTVANRHIDNTEEFKKLMTEGKPLIVRHEVFTLEGGLTGHVILIAPIDNDTVVVIDANKEKFAQKMSMEKASYLPKGRSDKLPSGGKVGYLYQITKKN